MDLNSQPSTLWLLVVVVMSQGLVTGSSSTQRSTQSQEQPPLQQTLLKKMDNIQTHLADLTRSMGDLDDEIATALYNCLGLHTELCEALEIDSRLTNRQQMKSSWSPGKRSPSADPKVNMYRRLFDDLARKRALLYKMSDLFQGASDVMTNERKRSCKVNLGFHCQTQEVSDFADWYNYLESPHSPGRKRSVGVAH